MKHFLPTHSIQLLRSLLMLVGLLTMASSAMAAPKVTAKLDSAYIIMGKQTTLHLEAVMPETTQNYQVILPNDTIVDKVEIISLQADTSVADGLRTLRQNIILQSFDSGLYAIPPIKVMIGNDTALSNHLVLKVVPVSVDTLQGKIHDFAGVASPPSSFFDIFPSSFDWFKWIVGIILLIGLIYAVYYYFVYERRRPVKKVVVMVPPYEQAKEALNRLREEHLCEHGQEREYYTRLTDILRVYLDRRFGISAMEMTSSQILQALSSNEATRWSRTEIQQVLEMADFVKFAKMRPLPDDNVKTFRKVEEFVETTKPKPEPEPEADSTASGSNPTGQQAEQHKGSTINLTKK